MHRKKIIIAGLISYPFFICFYVLVEWLVSKFIHAQTFRALVIGSVCKADPNTTWFSAQNLSYILLKSVLLYQAWRITIKQKEGLINMMILCLPVFNLWGGLHALMFEIHGISIQLGRLGIYKSSNLFFADSTIYFLSKFYFTKDYILPLTYGAVGTYLLFKYLKKAKHGKKVLFLTVAAIGISIICTLMFYANFCLRH
jgi:hypothetical protein